LNRSVIYGNVKWAVEAAFTPDTCSPYTSCIQWYPLVSGYKLLVRDTCIRVYPATSIWCKRGGVVWYAATL